MVAGGAHTRGARLPHEAALPRCAVLSSGLRKVVLNGNQLSGPIPTGKPPRERASSLCAGGRRACMHAARAHMCPGCPVCSKAEGGSTTPIMTDAGAPVMFPAARPLTPRAGAPQQHGGDLQ